ncbi:adenine-specific methyltransferase EcoRI family protein [Porphyromonas endodontalis]|uniref:adenine-specific methyltransferase EcoRI family protein n=1 Tax=Porphyromonas endodontalis TaxID=28124 RepID=UPI0023F0C56E|nr:adenine-specific methyltransferase EcoRI family protein [Porphyromonas endodontalis]
MANKNLTEAKATKNDEFYTQFHDIEMEMEAYLEYNPNVFRDKTILLPCDDPEWSNFTRYFAAKFEELGIKKLISTSFAPESKNFKSDYNPLPFEIDDPLFNPQKTAICGKIYTLTHDINHNGRIDIDDLEWKYLEGTGDFRSPEVTALRDEADIIITNPPFSLFREFLAWIMEGRKQFAIIGNMNAITYKEVFPLIKKNEIWLGATNFNTGMYFYVPNNFKYADTYKFEREHDGKAVNRVPGCCWYSNLEHGRRHQPLALMTMEDNLRYNKKMKGKKAYDRYDNYDAIEVPYTNAIPSDYNGVMGVPISFLDKYCPEQFEILGIDRYIEDNPIPGKRFTINSKEVYARILIRWLV